MPGFPVVKVWRMLRGGADAMRYHADIVGSLIASGGIREGFAIQDLDPKVLEVLETDWDDPPPCRPPGPCDMNPEEVSRHIQKVAKRVQATSDAVCALLRQMHAGSHTIAPYFSTVPGAHWK